MQKQNLSARQCVDFERQFHPKPFQRKHQASSGRTRCTNLTHIQKCSCARSGKCVSAILLSDTPATQSEMVLLSHPLLLSLALRGSSADCDTLLANLAEPLAIRAAVFSTPQ